MPHSIFLGRSRHHRLYSPIFFTIAYIYICIQLLIFKSLPESYMEAEINSNYFVVAQLTSMDLSFSPVKTTWLGSIDQATYRNSAAVRHPAGSDIPPSFPPAQQLFPRTRPGRLRAGPGALTAHACQVLARQRSGLGPAENCVASSWHPRAPGRGAHPSASVHECAPRRSG